MIRKLRLQGYKSFADATLEASPLTVVFGPNDGGKSNLLDAVALLAALADADRLGRAFATQAGERPLEAFHSPRGFGEEGLSAQHARGTLELGLTVDFDLPVELRERLNAQLLERERIAETQTSYTRVVEGRLRYHVALALEQASGELFVQDESLVPLTREGEPSLVRHAFFAFDPARGLFLGRIERQSQPRWFDPRRRRTLLSELSDLVYHPHVVAAKEEVRSWRRYAIEPLLLRQAFAGFFATSTGSEEPGPHGEGLVAFLWKLSREQPDAFAALQEALRRVVPSLDGVTVRDVRGGIEAMVVASDGGEFPFRLASEGTLRLLGLLAVVLSPEAPSTLAIEGPEICVPAGRVEALADVLAEVVAAGNRQLLLTSHSPALLQRLATARLVRCFRDEQGGSRFEEWGERDRMFVAEGIDESGAPPP